eukprot:364473-Chlamydomonas_euryale.AAC.2
MDLHPARALLVVRGRGGGTCGQSTPVPAAPLDAAVAAAARHTSRAAGPPTPCTHTHMQMHPHVPAAPLDGLRATAHWPAPIL